MAGWNAEAKASAYLEAKTMMTGRVVTSGVEAPAYLEGKKVGKQVVRVVSGFAGVTAAKLCGRGGDEREGIPRGLKPRFVTGQDAEAKALAYLKPRR